MKKWILLMFLVVILSSCNGADPSDGFDDQTDQIPDNGDIIDDNDDEDSDSDNGDIDDDDNSSDFDDDGEYTDDDETTDTHAWVFEALDYFSTLLNIMPEKLVIETVGEEHEPIEDLSSGNRYMYDEEIIEQYKINPVTSPYYETMVNKYNAVLFLGDYLNFVFPLVSLLDTLDEPIENDMASIMLTYDEDRGYLIEGQVTALDQTFDLTIDIEKMHLINGYTYTVYLESEYYEHYFEISRDLITLHEITKVTRYIDDTYGFTEVMHLDMQSEAPRLFVFHYTGGIERRWLFDLQPSYTSIYYKNNQTGTEIMQYLNASHELVFEYEDYMPNQLFGSEKARWFLNHASGWETITFEEKGFMGSSSVYHIDEEEVPRDTSDLRIEAKQYIIINNQNTTPTKEAAETWVYRIDGVYGDNRLFDVNPLLGIQNDLVIETAINHLYQARSDIYIFGTHMMEITHERVLSEIRANE